ncbi:hypothetical protein OBBRIDRAFT_81852 [Obba rivulosa]|uniref:Uncharacterized protein n=1 Tax=Obba rivulosa TaxID=1052685 RepID=A0A8E2DK76_9APHY|nr:hypothetical protein OBBRIDRAFT_81852 [Obba rivulosa]
MSTGQIVADAVPVTETSALPVPRRSWQHLTSILEISYSLASNSENQHPFRCSGNRWQRALSNLIKFGCEILWNCVAGGNCITWILPPNCVLSHAAGLLFRSTSTKSHATWGFASSGDVNKTHGGGGFRSSAQDMWPTAPRVPMNMGRRSH